MFKGAIIAVLLVALSLSYTEARIKLPKCRKFVNVNRPRAMRVARAANLDESNEIHKMIEKVSSKRMADRSKQEVGMLNDMLCDLERCTDMGEGDLLHQESCSMVLGARVLQMKADKMGINKPKQRAKKNNGNRLPTLRELPGQNPEMMRKLKKNMEKLKNMMKP